MQGKIVMFHEDLNVGVIKTDDGRKVRFAPSDIRNPNGRYVGYDVDFVQPGPGQPAKDIILLTGTPWQVFADPRNGASRTPACRAFTTPKSRLEMRRTW